MEKLELSLTNKKISYELEKLQKQFLEKVEENNAIWVRDLEIADVLKSSQNDRAKLEEIQKLMDLRIRTIPVNNEIKTAKILLENNRLHEQNSLLELELDELKKQHALEMEKLKNEHQKAIIPPVPPRRFHHTNPFANDNH